MYPVSNWTEAAQIADRWKGCCEDLYHDEEGNGTEQEYWEQEPPPLHSEVACAIHQTASCRATGADDVPAELLKAGGETTLDRICVAIWETGEWPEEWTFCTFPRQVILNSVKTTLLLWFPMQARCFFGSY